MGKEYSIILLYAHQWNTRWAFAWKHNVFMCENDMPCSQLKDHHCYGQYMVAWSYKNLLVLKSISPICCTQCHKWNTFQYLKTNLLIPVQPCYIFYVMLLVFKGCIYPLMNFVIMVLRWIVMVQNVCLLRVRF